MQQSNQITIDIAEGSTFPIVLGKSKDIKFNLGNGSSTDRAYNVSVNINLADSLEMLSSSIDATNVIKEDNNSKTYNYVNLKDLVENENNYKMDFDVKSNEYYASGEEVEFGDRLQCVITVTWDSMPRGSFDAGNIEYYNTVNFEFDITRLLAIKKVPPQKLKGAGTDTITPSKIFQSIVEIQNNSKENEVFNLKDVLPDGIRYLGNITVISGIENPLPTPTVTFNSETGEKIIDFEDIVILKGEFLKFSYQCAIWNNFSRDGVENEGARILHGTNLVTTINAKNDNFDVSDTATIKAMDTILSIWDNSPTVDVSSVVNYTVRVQACQYYNINNVTATAFIPDGQQPVDVGQGIILPELADNSIPVEFNIPEIVADTNWHTTLTSNVIAQYRSDLDYVSCGDTFIANADMSGENIYSQLVTDASSSSQSIIVPTVTKDVANIYYRDMTPKNGIIALAPLDWVEYELTLDCRNIIAVKRNILLDDFFPYDFELPDTENIVQIQGEAVTPEAVSPHGLRWNLGNFSETIWKVRVKTQVGSTGNSENYVNLFKMSGTNHSNESYSNRTQVSQKGGKPNIQITRTYVDFNPSRVSGGVEYTCKLKISNNQNSEGTATDAFGFQVVEQSYDGIQIIPDSVTVDGTAFYASPQSSSYFVTCQVFRMFVGQEITLTYKVILPTNINPGFKGNLASQVGIPYTQIFNSLLQNVLYEIDDATSSVKLKTKDITFNNNYTNSTLQVGDTVNYILNYTIPEGTTIYIARLINTLPVGQSLTGDVYLNGELISVTTSGQDIIFPNIAEINPTESDGEYSYTFSAVINNAVTDYPTTQVNNAELNYTIFDESSKKVTTSKNVIIYNPLLNLSLTSLNGYILKSSSLMKTQLSVRNISNIGARECVIKIPVPNNSNLLSATSSLGNVIISEDNTMVTWDIGNLSGLQSGSLLLNLKGKIDIAVNDNVNITANSLEYKNEKSDTKLFPQVNSNVLTYNCIPNVHVDVYPANKTLAGNGFYQFTSNTVINAMYSIINSAGGVDSFTLEISPIKWNYDLFMGDTFVQSVEANTAFSSQPTQLQDLPAGNTRDVKLKIYIPQLTGPDSDIYTIKAISSVGEQYYATMQTVLMDP